MSLGRIVVQPGASVDEHEVAKSSLIADWLGGRAQTRWQGWEPGWEVREIRIYHALRRGNEIFMLFVEVDAVSPDGQEYTRSIVLRGATVDILTVLIAPDGTKHAVLTEEVRPGLGVTMLANAAGMVDTGERPYDAAQREAWEEVAGGLECNDLISLNEKLFGDERTPFFVSPGTTDEIAFLYAREIQVSWRQLEQLNGQQAGLTEENEVTTNRIVPLSEAISAMSAKGRPCMKAVLSITAYEK